MKNIKKYTLISFMFVLFTGIAQTSQVRAADKKFNNFEYTAAAVLYNKAIDKGVVNQDIITKLADSYYFNADYSSAAKWYKKLSDYDVSLTPEYLFRLGQSFKSIGDYKAADKYLGLFYKSEGIAFKSTESYLNALNENANMYTVNSVAFNTEYSDYPAFLEGDSLYVISASNDRKISKRHNQPTSNIFLREGELVKPLSEHINSKFNEGSLVITNDGNKMFFTRNDYDGKKLGKDTKELTRLKLYSAEKVSGEWKNIKELPFNNSNYSVGHPALSKDNRTLYFISDMQDKNNHGATDIYQVLINSDGSFGEVINTPNVNTLGSEMFPFVDQDDTLYFSSNGYVNNLGGLDIYKSIKEGNAQYSKVENLGAPINSVSDDFAMVINSEEKSGYFSSNRAGSVDQIYRFEENKAYQPPCVNLIYKGAIKDKLSKQSINAVLVSLLDADHEVISQKTINGAYTFEKVPCDKVKFIRAEKTGFETAEVLASTPIEGVAVTDLQLSKIVVQLTKEVKLEKGVDLALILNPILFDFNKFNIRPDAEIELNKIVSVMQDNPTVIIDVRAHTDSMGNDDYNLILSDNRAKSTMRYLISKGIDSFRITGKGYGETQLKNQCDNTTKCTVEEHSANRRSEFIVVSM